MAKPRRYRRLPGDSAYYPYAARTRLRHARNRSAWLLRALGLALLLLAAALGVRQVFFNGGQPAAPAIPTATAEQAASSPTAHPLSISIQAATVDALAGSGQTDAAPGNVPPRQTAETAAPDILPQYRDLYAQNPDLVGWLKIDGTKIDYPVLQTPADNEYYLRRGFDGLYSTAGSLFLDARCRLGSDPTANWLVYGHNMGDGSMFAALTQYADEDFYAAHPVFTFDTLTEAAQWQVVAVIRTELGADEMPYYSFFDAESRTDWQRRVDAICALSLYDAGSTPQYGQQLLTLSTCGSTALGTKSRLAVLAVRADAEGN